MFRHRMRVAAVAALSATGLSAPATAVPLEANYVGAVADSWDSTGYFGLGTGASLDGAGFILTFVYDPDTPGAVRQSVPGLYDQASGGDAYNRPSPMLSAVLTINGRSVNFIGNENATFTVRQFGRTPEIAHEFANSTDDGITRNSSRANVDVALRGGAPGLVKLDSAFTSAALDLLSAGFVLDLFDHATQTSAFIRGTLLPAQLTVSGMQVTPVPVPASLPLLGFAVAMLMAVRRKTGKALSAALR